MTKWYVICGVLAVLWLISLGTCSSNSAGVGRVKAELADAREELDAAKEELADTRAELTTVKDGLAKLQDDYEELRQEYTVLQGTKEMVFGEGVRLFDIQWKKGYWGILEGKVRNISDKPMERVEIIVAEYSQDGSLRDFYSTTESDLFPQEVAEWSIYSIFLEDGGLYEKEIDEILAIYAFGNRGG